MFFARVVVFLDNYIIPFWHFSILFRQVRTIKIVRNFLGIFWLLRFFHLLWRWLVIDIVVSKIKKDFFTCIFPTIFIHIVLRWLVLNF
jgi:hypothetical protein